MHFGKCCSFHVGAWRWDSQDPADLGARLDDVGVAVAFWNTQIPPSSGQSSEQFGVHPDTLHYSSFEEPNTVYCIFQVDFEFSRLRTGYRQPSSLLCVGSTAVGAAKRHLNRMAVYRRLKKTEFVDAEQSLRYWASHDNLFQFALRSYENYQLAWVTEDELIAPWQTPLNYPRAMALIKKTALG